MTTIADAPRQLNTLMRSFASAGVIVADKSGSLTQCVCYAQQQQIAYDVLVDPTETDVTSITFINKACNQLVKTDKCGTIPIVSFFFPPHVWTNAATRKLCQQHAYVIPGLAGQVIPDGPDEGRRAAIVDKWTYQMMQMPGLSWFLKLLDQDTMPLPVLACTAIALDDDERVDADTFVEIMGQLRAVRDTALADVHATFPAPDELARP